jgi:hypothetical protein
MQQRASRRSAFRRTSANAAAGSPTVPAPRPFIATDAGIIGATRSAGSGASRGRYLRRAFCAIVHNPRAAARRTGSLVSFNPDRQRNCARLIACKQSAASTSLTGHVARHEDACACADECVIRGDEDRRKDHQICGDSTATTAPSDRIDCKVTGRRMFAYECGVERTGRDRPKG